MGNTGIATILEDPVYTEQGPQKHTNRDRRQVRPQVVDADELCEDNQDQEISKKGQATGPEITEEFGVTGVMENFL